LGITLIQYGFTLRAKLEGSKDGVVGSTNDDWPGWKIGDPAPSEGEFFPDLAQNATALDPTSGPGSDGNVTYMSGAGITTTEWLSFFLMTIGALDFEYR
jgi:hypothetical protein